MWKSKKRKNDIVIRGLMEEVAVTKRTVDFFKEECKKQNEQHKAKAGLYNRKQKIKISKNKRKLKGSNIFIDDDITNEERNKENGKNRKG